MGLNLPDPLHIMGPGKLPDPAHLFGSDDSSPAGLTAAQKAQQQANAAIKQINDIYSDPSRQKQYSDYYNSVLSAQQNALGQQQADAERQRKFAVARSGLSGGSSDIFSQEQLGEDLANANAEAVTRALNAQGSLESADQQQKQSLLALAESGALNSGANDAATSALASALANAKGNEITTDFSNFFGNLAPIYQASLNADALRQLGQQYAAQGALNNISSIPGIFGPAWG